METPFFDAFISFWDFCLTHFRVDVCVCYQRQPPPGEHESAYRPYCMAFALHADIIKVMQHMCKMCAVHR